MASSVATTLREEPAGFSFENYHRNAMLAERMAAANGSALAKSMPQPRKTGTTIVGVIYAHGVVLGADTRATSDSEIAEKQSDKIHYVAPNMYCCGAGTAADTEQLTKLMASQLELLRLESNVRTSRVVTAVTRFKRHLFKYQGHIGAALILGGCDIDGPKVVHIFPHGSTSSQPYTSMGSGSMAAMAVLETSWHEGMTEAQALALVQRAIGAGIFNDLGSGSQCDTCVIRMDGTTDLVRGRDAPEPYLNDVRPLRHAIQHSNRLLFLPGTTPVLSTSFTPHPPSRVAPTRLAAAGDDDEEVVEMET